MNNYQESIPFSFEKRKQRFNGSTSKFIKFKSGFKHTIKSRTIEKSNLFLDFIVWNVAFFSLFPLVSASVASFVDESYNSQKDLYDALLNTLFPILFVVLYNVSGKSGSIRNVLLPLLDDILYNAITWMIPLIVSFSYDDLMGIKIFSIINMCLHIICALIAIVRWKKVKNIVGTDENNETDNIDNTNKENLYKIYISILFFLVLFPVIVISLFWIIIIIKSHIFDSINIVFLILFGTLMVFSIMYILCVQWLNIPMGDNLGYILTIMFFYIPNLLQTLLILLSWPINFYFVKACVFILILYLTRITYYFINNVPDDFLATSTTFIHVFISKILKNDNGTQISMNEMQITINKMKVTMDEMKGSMEKMEISISEMKSLT